MAGLMVAAEVVLSVPGQADEQDRDDRSEVDGIDLADAFRQAWATPQDGAAVSPDLLPVRLARACVEVLGVDGAGFSFYYDDFRVPVGASDDVATVAERLQFTQGEGPCLESAATHRMMVADTAELESRWPAFAEELFKLTPFRSVVSLPLALTRQSFAALDLFLVDPDSARRLSLTDVHTVSDQAARALAAAVSKALATTGIPEETTPFGADPNDDLMPLWLAAPTAQARTHVWVAMGMVITKFGLTAGDAVSLLRSYAYGRGELLDDVAVALVDGRINLADVGG